jgi:hypothetical protein
MALFFVPFPFRLYFNLVRVKAFITITPIIIFTFVVRLAHIFSLLKVRA